MVVAHLLAIVDATGCALFALVLAACSVDATDLAGGDLTPAETGRHLVRDAYLARPTHPAAGRTRGANLRLWTGNHRGLPPRAAVTAEFSTGLLLGFTSCEVVFTTSPSSVQ